MIKELLFNVYFSVFILFINTSISDNFLRALFINPSLISITRLLTNIIFILIVIYYFLIERIRIRKYILGIAMLVLMVLTLAWTPNKFESIKLIINIIGPLYYFLLLCLNVKKGKILKIIRVYCIIILVFDIIALILPSGIGYMDSVSKVLNGIHLSRSSFVVYINFIIFINWIYFMQNRNKYNTNSIIPCIVIMLSLILVIISKSSTGLITILLFFIFTLVLRRKKLSYYIFYFSLITGIVLPFMHLNSPILDKIVTIIFGKTLTFSGRTYIWKYVLGNLIDNPILGNGFNSTHTLLADKVVPIYDRVAAHSHNGFLEVFLQSGIIGLILVVTILITAFRSTEYMGKVQKSIFKSYIITLIIFNYMEPYLNDQVSLITVWLPIIYIIVSKYKDIKNNLYKIDCEK